MGAATRMASVVERRGAVYASAEELELSAGIAVKKLPGSDAVVACWESRCVKLTSGFLREGDVTLVDVAALAKALSLAVRFSDDRRQVQVAAEGTSSPVSSAIASVGDLAPNFRVSRLDGTPVSLADFRGKRVLIQSWASW